MYALRCAKNNKKKEKTHFLIFLSKNDMTGGNIIYPNKKRGIRMNKFTLGCKLLRDSKPGSKQYWVALAILRSC